MSQTVEHATSGPIPPNCEVIEVHLEELKQLFHGIDPSPFRQRNIDPDAEDYIVNQAKDLPGDAPLALLAHVDRPAGSLPEETAILHDAIREFFSHRGGSCRQRLQQLFRVGRKCLLVGILFLAASIAIGDVIANALAGQRLGEIARESFLIGGWVAMWRPLEIFLYEWWPIRAEAVLFDRLSAMQVRIAYAQDTSSLT